jgi:hypothetical protein
MKRRERERGIILDCRNENLATLQLSVANFQNSRDETLHNKPIIFVPKRVKTHVRQCRIQKISGGGPPDPPLQGEGEGGREEGWGGKGEERVGEGR